MIDSIQDLSEYSVHIEEHFVRTIKIQARDLEEAMSLAGEIYDSQKPQNRYYPLNLCRLTMSRLMNVLNG